MPGGGWIERKKFPLNAGLIWVSYMSVLENSVPMIELTKRQKQLIAYLKEHHRKKGFMPSTREIQDHFGFASQTAAMGHLRALERKGAIKRLANKARAVVFPEDLARDEMVDVPLLGSIAAGFPAEASQVAGPSISLNSRSLGLGRNPRLFALKVFGDSMIEAHICNGDTVILEARPPAHNDVVAALIDGETTLKRYLLRRGKPYLKAENSNFQDLIPAEELYVQGVLVMVMRRISTPAA